jgi:hypothetical protein
LSFIGEISIFLLVLLFSIFTWLVDNKVLCEYFGFAFGFFKFNITIGVEEAIHMLEIMF